MSHHPHSAVSWWHLCFPSSPFAVWAIGPPPTGHPSCTLNYVKFTCLFQFILEQSHGSWFLPTQVILIIWSKSMYKQFRTGFRSIALHYLIPDLNVCVYPVAAKEPQTLVVLKISLCYRQISVHEYYKISADVDPEKDRIKASTF